MQAVDSRCSIVLAWDYGEQHPGGEAVPGSHRAIAQEHRDCWANVYNFGHLMQSGFPDEFTWLIPLKEISG